MRNSIKLLVAAFLLFTLQTNAQWNFNGSNVHNINTGNVGIGTNSPAEKLSVFDSDATIRLEDSDGEGNSTIVDTYDASWSSMFINKYSTLGNSQISITPMPEDGTGSSIIRLFRTTNTTGNVSLFVHKGDGSGTINSALRGNGDNYVNASTGNFGIGTNSPAKKLSIFDSDAVIRLEDSDGNGVSVIKDVFNSSWSTMQIAKYNTTGNSQITIDPSPGDHVSDAIFRFFRTTSTTGNVGFYIHKGDGSATVNSAFRGNGNSYVNASTGNFSVGTTDAQGYKFAVAGSAAIDGMLKATEVEVKLDVWSDYVFNEDYELKSLHELEIFINQNKHLPGVPSEKEVTEIGVNLGEMDAILLEKIEELTLYVIELKKENELMKTQIRELMEK